MFNKTTRIGHGFIKCMEITYPRKWIDDRPEGCPLCNTEFKVGDNVMMILTNNTFPNTIIHTACIDHDLLLTAHALLNSFEHFSRFISSNRGWYSEELKDCL